MKEFVEHAVSDLRLALEEAERDESNATAARNRSFKMLKEHQQRVADLQAAIKQVEALIGVEEVVT